MLEKLLLGPMVFENRTRGKMVNAISRDVELRDSSNVVSGHYSYDGDGKRVKKVVPSTSETTVFAYDASGKMVAEYSTVISQDPKVNYTTSDHLGSPRVLTDQNGAVISRRDFHPFGEEIITAQRTQGLGYVTDDIRQKFTSYERDAETSLDFAQARMYSKNHGRFLSVDRENIGADSSLPQSWNGYSYVMNSPLEFVDPTGLIWLRRRMTDTYIWIDDDVYERNLKKDKNYYSDYIRSNDVVITVTGGTAATPDQIGKMVLLCSDGNIYPITQRDIDIGTVHIGTDDPLRQMLDGFEHRGAMWFWRPAIYWSSPVVMLPAIPVMGGGSAAGGGILTLGLSSTEIPAGLALSPSLIQAAVSRGVVNPAIYLNYKGT
ncbi:MAG: hypothetical protein JFAIHJKO_02138 [Pyrinomonadaceae bacterium]|nr:hypothetical protein [Pyrinomonadaceae bacterium]